MNEYGLAQEDKEDSILNLLPDPSLEKVQKRDMDWMPAMEARISYDLVSDDEWLFERHLDGERVLAFKEDDKVALCLKNGEVVNKRYPELVEELRAIDDLPDCIFDGEVVALDGEKKPSSEHLSVRRKIHDSDEALESEVEVLYYLFDCIYCDGYDLRGVPLRDRRAFLKKIMDWEDPIRFLTYQIGGGKKYFKEACRKEWSGIVAKQTMSTYIGKRTMQWRKFLCSREVLD